MGLDLIYVRCAEALIAAARSDRRLAEELIGGGGGATEAIDIGRSEDRLYRLLGPFGSVHLGFSAAHDDWAGLALSGDAWLHPGIDTGYGTPRFLVPAAVATIARQLEPLTEAAFVARFEGVVDDAARLRDHLLPNFLRLRRFYLDAARAQQAVVVTPS